MKDLLTYDAESEVVRRTDPVNEFLTILFKHKVKVIASVLTVVTIVTTMTLLIAPVYEAKSTVLVKMGREYLNSPEASENAPVMSLDQNGVISAEIQIMTNRDLIEQVIKTLKIENIYPDIAENRGSKINPLDASILKFEEALYVDAVKKSSVIQVAFQHKDPRVAAQAVNLLVNFFRDKHLQVFSEPRSNYLEQQYNTYAQKLKESETRLEDYKQKNNVFSLPEQRTLLLKQRMDLDTALKSTQNNIAALQKTALTLKSQMNNIIHSDADYMQPERERLIAETKAKLLALQLNEQQLLKKYTESSRVVVSARNETEMVKNYLRELEDEGSRKTKIGNPLYQGTKRELLTAETELSAQRAKAASLISQLKRTEREIQSLELSERQLENIVREKNLNEKNYQTYAAKAEEARRSDEMDRLKLANISIIQQAAVPIRPVKQSRAKSILLGFVAGMALGIGAAYFSEHAARSFSTPERVEKLLGVPVIISIPYDKG